MEHPRLFERAVLLRPMLGWTPPEEGDLSGLSVLILIGRHDQVVSPKLGHRLAESLRHLGAQVEVHEVDSGHQLTDHDLALARDWLAQPVPV